MKEARRFLRYVLPGLVLLIEVCLYLWLSSYHQFVEFIEKFGKEVAFPVSVFFASGGIGFLLSLIYHVLYWTVEIEGLAVDHRPLIKDAVNRNWLKLQRRGNDKEVDDSKKVAEELTQAGAWCIVTSFWHERRESSPRIKGANPRTDSLSDIMHGLGTTVIGSIIAIPLWVYAHYRFLTKLPSVSFSLWWGFHIIVHIAVFITVLILALLVVFIHFVGFCKMVKFSQSVVDMIVSDELQKESSENNTPVIINVAQIDLKKQRRRRS